MISEKENQSFEEWNESADLGRGNISEGAPACASADAHLVLPWHCPLAL